MTVISESSWARRARHFCALERRLFEVLGGWVPSEPDHEAKVLLRVHAFQHAWHAELWAAVLPVGESAEGAASSWAGNAVAVALDELAAVEGTGERLAAVYGSLLPRLVATYEDVAARLDEASGGPERRVVDLVLADDREACRAGEALLERTGGGAVAVGAGVWAVGGLDVLETA